MIERTENGSMSQPEIVQDGLAGEDIVAQVDLGGEDELYVTPTRTLVYRAEGLLSDEGVREYRHGAERITVSEGRRKSKITLEYGLDGEETITLPSSRLTRALQPIVEGVLRQNGVLEDDESVVQLFRFSELTVAVASQRVVRHIGPGLWDQELESYHYSDVTDLAFEDGSVNTSIVLTVGGQQERFKTPNEDARAVRSAIESTLLSYWEVDSLEAFRAAAAPDAPADEPDGSDESGGTEDVSFGDGPDPLFADPAEPEEFPDNATRADDEGTAEPDISADVTTEPTAPEDSPSEPAGGTSTAPSQPDPEEGVVESGGVTDIAAEPDVSPTAEGAPEAVPSHATDDGSGPPGGEATDRTPDGAKTQNPPESIDAGFEGSGFEAATPAVDEEILEEVAELREVVERQNEELTAQRELLEQLIEELRRGR